MEKQRMPDMRFGYMMANEYRYFGHPLYRKRTAVPNWLRLNRRLSTNFKVGLLLAVLEVHSLQYDETTVYFCPASPRPA
jgi:hypothetical protein